MQNADSANFSMRIVVSGANKIVVLYTQIIDTAGMTCYFVPFIFRTRIVHTCTYDLVDV